MTDGESRGWVSEKTACVLVCLGLTLVTAWTSWHRRAVGIEVAAAVQHNVFLHAPTKAPAPGAQPLYDFLDAVYATRVLFPVLLHYTNRLTGLPINYAFVLLRVISIFTAYLLLNTYLRAWFGAREAILGVAVVAAIIPVTYVEWFEIPTDFPELALIVLGLMCIRADRYGPLCLALAIATTNRETAGYLVIVYLFHSLKMGRRMLPTVVRTTALCLIWAGVYLGLKHVQHVQRLHYFFDPGAMLENLEGLLQLRNHPNIFNINLSWVYLFNVFLVFSFVRLKEKPLFIQSTMLTIPLLLAIFLLGAAGLDEARELMLLLPVIIPAALMTLLESLPPGRRVPPTQVMSSG